VGYNVITGAFRREKGKSVVKSKEIGMTAPGDH